MKRDLVEIGKELQKKVPFHTITREFEIKGVKFRIRVGWQVNSFAVVVKEADNGSWVDLNWSVVPRTLLQTLTKSIKAEADALLKGMDAFIEKECEAEIRESITDVICKKGETKSRQDILVEAINSRIKKMSDYFQTFPIPTTFTEFHIVRSFDVPRPPAISKEHWDRTKSIHINQDGFGLNAKVQDTEDAMAILMVMPQIAEFALMVYTQLAHLAEWEKSQ